MNSDTNRRLISNSIPEEMQMGPLKRRSTDQPEGHEHRQDPRRRLGSEKMMDKELYNRIVSPDNVFFMEEENFIQDRKEFLENCCVRLESEISEKKQRLDCHDPSGESLRPGEEEQIPTPQWASKGTNCSSTHYYREQIIKHHKLKCLAKDKLSNMNITSELSLVDLKSPDKLYENDAHNKLEHLHQEARNIDLIRELVGPDHVSARRHQLLVLEKIRVEELSLRKDTLELYLEALDFNFQVERARYKSLSEQNFQRQIDAVPKFNIKKLFCRNKKCPDCKHKSMPTLKSYGLQKKPKKYDNPDATVDHRHSKPGPSPRHETQLINHDSSNRNNRSDPYIESEIVYFSDSDNDDHNSETEIQYSLPAVKYPQFSDKFNDYCNKVLYEYIGTDEYGDDREIPLDGLAERMRNNSYEARLPRYCRNNDFYALEYLIQCRTAGTTKLHEKWKMMRKAEARTRSKQNTCRR